MHENPYQAPQQASRVPIRSIRSTKLRAAKPGEFTLRDLLRTLLLIALFVLTSVPILLNYIPPELLKIPLFVAFFSSAGAAAGSIFRRTWIGTIIGLLVAVLILALIILLPAIN